jgi:hypothetical protein
MMEDSQMHIQLLFNVNISLSLNPCTLITERENIMDRI